MYFIELLLTSENESLTMCSMVTTSMSTQVSKFFVSDIDYCHWLDQLCVNNSYFVVNIVLILLCLSDMTLGT